MRPSNFSEDNLQRKGTRCNKQDKAKKDKWALSHPFVNRSTHTLEKGCIEPNAHLPSYFRTWPRAKKGQHSAGAADICIVL